MDEGIRGRRGTPTDGGSIFSNTDFLVTLWVLSFTVFILTPLCWNKYRRALWWKRLRTCRWSVEVDVEEPEPEWYRLAMERYDAYRERANELENNSNQLLTREEEEEIRQLFLLERMAGFTKVVQEQDVIHKAVPTEAPAAPKIERLCEETQDETQSSISQKESRENHLDSMEKGKSDLIDEKREIVNTNNETPDGVSDDEDDEKLCAIDGDNIDFGESNTFIQVPNPGISMASGATATRLVPNGCAICLSEFEVGDRLTWSSNDQCAHAFHEDCLLRWMLSVGKKKSRRRRNNIVNDDPETEQVTDPVQIATDFPMLCPCCRQPFISKELPAIEGNHADADDGDGDADAEQSSQV